MNCLYSDRFLIFPFKLILFISILISSVCAQQTSYPYTPPPDLNDGLKVASVKSVGIDKEDIEKLNRKITNSDYGYLSALAIVKDGKLVYEGYFHGAGRNDRYTIYSVSKTFTSALVGIAIDKGFIKNVDQPVLPFFTEYENVVDKEQKRKIKIHHLLSLSSGIDWDESTYSYEDNRNIHVQMEMTNDWIKFILQRRMKDKPGFCWLYNTGNVQLLSAIIKKATGLYLHQFAEKYLFGPLKIDNYYWNTDPSGYTCAGGSDGGLRLKTRDVAKLGCLYTNKGLWNGKRVLSEAWIKKSTQGYITTRGNREYGYLWHVCIDESHKKPYKFFYHSGSGGHVLMVYPELNLVLVINSGPNNVEPICKAVINMITKN